LLVPAAQTPVITLPNRWDETSHQALAECRSCCPPELIAVSSSPVEHEFNCPYCGEEISMVLDLSVGRQTYIEDCEVCCKPIEISFTVEDDELADFSANTLE
jgi:Cysteine-rich CPXCG